ncbi:hypothetical protein ACTXT7_011695 [Hymenolepis weldensis]
MEGYICPSDRQLALRARLGTGWSTVAQANQRRVNTRFSNEELDHICRVLQRNESLNERENRRVESMLQRLENMKMATVPQSKTTCSYCGHEFGILLKSSAHCADCGRLVCSHCSIEFTKEVTEKPKPVQDTSNISPSRYLPPGSTAAVAAETKTGSGVLQRLWRSRQMSEQRGDVTDGSGPLDQPAFNGSAGGRSKHKSFSLERRQSLSRISHLFTIPRPLTPSTALTPTSNRYHLCKLCCEAREIEKVELTYLEETVFWLIFPILHCFLLICNFYRRWRIEEDVNQISLDHVISTVWKRTGAWFHQGFPKNGLHSSCPASPLASRSVTTVDGWTSFLARGPTESSSTGGAALGSDDDWTRIEKRPPETGHSNEGTSGHSGLNATRYTAEGIVNQKISREESGSPPDTVVANSENNGGSNAIALTGSPLSIFDNSSWKSSSDQQQSSQHLSSPISKLNPKISSSIHEPLSQNSFQTIERSPQRGRETKIQSLFPETKMALGLGSSKIIPPTFPPPPDLKFKKEPSSFRKVATAFAEAPLGILYFSATHDVSNCALHIRIHNAKVNCMSPARIFIMPKIIAITPARKPWEENSPANFHFLQLYLKGAAASPPAKI